MIRFLEINAADSDSDHEALLFTCRLGHLL